MIELEIISDKQLLKLGVNTDFSLDFKIQDIASITAIQSNVSTSFKIPVFNDYETLQLAGQSNKPYTYIGCRLRVDGVYIFQSGTFAIEEVENNDYLITLYEGNVDFVSELEGLTFADLDLSAIDHQWQLSEVTGSFNNTWSSGYIYPFIQYGAQANSAWSGNARTEFLHPAIFIKYIIQEIFSQFSIYTPTGSAYTDTFFEKCIMPFSTAYKTARWRRTEDAVTNVGGAFTAIADGGNTYWAAIYSNDSQLNEYDETEGFLNNKTTCLYGEAYIDNSSGSDGTFGIYKIGTDGTTVTTLGSTTVTAIVTTYNVQALDVSLLKGEKVFLGFEVPGGVPAASSVTWDDYDFHFGFNYMSEQTPQDIELVDFVKAVFAMFGIISEVDNVSNNLILHKFEELQDNKASSLDWSDKIDLGQRFKLDYHATDYAQENFFAYKEIPQVDNTISRQSFPIADATLEGVKDWISVELSACEEQPILGSSNVIIIEKYTLKPGETSVYLMTEDTQPRIAYIEDDLVDTTFTDGIDTFNASPAQRIVGRFDSLQFSNLLTTYYSDFQTIFTKYKKITAYFRLSQLDIANLDFFKPVFLNVGQPGKLFINGYFYINKINNYQAQKSTEVELIKIDI